MVEGVGADEMTRLRNRIANQLQNARSTAIGCALGYIVAVVCRPPPQFYRFTVIMTCFGNTGNIPIAIIGSVCHSSDQPFGPLCHQNGIAYVSFAQWVSVILAYTLVYHMMETPMEYYDVVADGNEIEEVCDSNVSRPLLHEAEWPGMEDKEASALLFWQHILAVFSLSIYVVVYFKLLSYI
ncbi:hypothetical protein KSP39_PZI022191 [Platanthera zijinensis]|uniref:Uncharacterized protein n=1 Tax=Platanthera zijinensis TaxID=2320716 RepID=A0AAP0AW66_9ASPA